MTVLLKKKKPNVPNVQQNVQQEVQPAMNGHATVQEKLDQLTERFAADARQVISADELSQLGDDVEVVVSLVRGSDAVPAKKMSTFDSTALAMIKRREQDIIIEARDVVKTYDTGTVTVKALRGVNLGIPRGEMVAIMGPSGCGKTTLLNTLSGLDEITSGDIIIDGESIKGMADRKRTRYRAERMGFIFQAYNLLPVLSAVENVELPLLVAGVTPREARPRAVEMLELVGLGNHLYQRPAELSGGQQQRVTIARALVNKPAIVWGDELTGALDSETSGEIMSLVRTLNDQTRQTFVIVTHDESVALQAHRIIRMRDGLVESEQRLR